eukprot:1536276-Lingulodinium_polyedra.AAC.1
MGRDSGPCERRHCRACGPRGARRHPCERGIACSVEVVDGIGRQARGAKAWRSAFRPAGCVRP